MISNPMPTNSSFESPVVRGPVVRWSSSAIWRLGLPLILFGVLWADLVRQLSYTWETSEQYAYGWFVPFFALALFWRRWMTRPAARPQVSPFWLVALVVLAAVVLLPVRVVYDINPDWPLCSWLMTLTVVGISLYAIFLLGGWTWVRYFAFPVCFILVAVQWPYRIEKALTQNLMQVVAGLTVELLGWFNIPAFQHGNLIELSTGVVGIDEACSGIRSFQSTLMAGLLMGELYRLRVWARAGLVGCGLLLAFCFNVVRTLLLSWQASQHGLSAIDKWHDPAGMTIAVACFFALWLLAVLIKHKWSTSTLPSPLRLDRGEGQGEVSPSSSLSSREMAKQPVSPGPLPSLQPLAFSLQPSFPRRYLLAVGCWAILCLVATEVWYRSHEVKDTGVFHWTVALPESKPGFEKVELAPRTLQLLAFDAESTGRWREDDGSEWTLDFFRWNPHSMQSVISARLHRPEACLPAAGLRQISMSPLDYFEAGPIQIPFNKYIFEAGGQQLYVFFSLWQDGDEQSGMRMLNQRDRMRWVLAGRRHLGQQTLEIICTGYPDMAAAEKAVRQRLPELIRIESQPTGTITSGR
jgi:exosortase